MTRCAALALALTGIGVVGGANLPAADAAGTSATSFGCYAKWYNTYSKGVCNPATQTGRVQLWVDRAAQFDYHGPFTRMSKGTRNLRFDWDEARHQARRADVNWRR